MDPLWNKNIPAEVPNCRGKKGRTIEWKSNESLHLKALVQKLNDYACKAAKRTANELSNPEEV